MNNKHFKNKKTLKIVGWLTLIPGAILSILGLASFFIAFSSMGSPDFFFLAFLGFPLVGIGSTLLLLGYKREISTYVKNEGVPVVKEIYEDLKPEFQDLTDTIKGKERQSIVCPKCGKVNDSDARFCDNCGTSLIKVCPYCNSSDDIDDKYCKKCGSRLL